MVLGSTFLRMYEGMSERSEILAILPTWRYPRHISVSLSSTMAPTQYTTPVSIVEHTHWFWVVEITKKVKFDQKKQPITVTVQTAQWQHPPFLIPQVVSSPFESPAKACAAMRSFCHWPLPMCKFTSPPAKTLLMLSLGTSTNSEERMRQLTLTYTYLPTPIILAWQTRRKANTGRRERWQTMKCARN